MATDPSIRFVMSMFARHYTEAALIMPERFAKREFGFMFFDRDFVMRHLAFPTRSALKKYLVEQVPAHAYYSCAYYETPDAPTMVEKKWQGADLIFDLDADHVEGAKSLPYEKMLERVKEEVKRLIDEFLLGDLGFTEDDLKIVFSGGRGYHVHIREIAVRGWGSQERRELIDYVCGIGIDPGVLLSGSPGGTPGWRERYISTISEYLLWLKGLGQEEGGKHLMELPGIDRKKAYRFVGAIDAHLEGLGKGDFAPLLADPVFSGLLGQEGGKFQELLRGRAALADEPVTTDTRRLIRLPTSLHGGSGLRVTPVPLGDLETFDPLQDAVVFSDRRVKVETGANIAMEILGNRYQVAKGMSAVPEALAVFLCARGLAEVAGEGVHAPR